ncbi:hypothetical protein SLEP1_g22858 [Rubroshorea leprosula]|uniref:Uncharacterized protein n=1 Tax=Rubroshorea leprosula TaxID=152421 RepID=A0AAV5JFU3_9ROSI|nr:hypothetical protein SLEP1_g22858 [Rubroshorea leprosula]
MAGAKIHRERKKPRISHPAAGNSRQREESRSGKVLG